LNGFEFCFVDEEFIADREFGLALRESYEQLRGLVGFVRDMVLYVI
jgi:hypothetical protein